MAKFLNDRRVKRKFGTRSPMYCIRRVLSMSDSVSSVWGHCSIVKIFEMLLYPQFSSNFNQTLWKVHSVIFTDFFLESNL